MTTPEEKAQAAEIDQLWGRWLRALALVDATGLIRVVWSAGGEATRPVVVLPSDMYERYRTMPGASDAEFRNMPEAKP